MNTTDNAMAAQKYRRRMRNYLLDVGLQVRYTMTIVIVAVFLTAGLGYKMYQATRDISKVIELSGMADPSVAEELQGQFTVVLVNAEGKAESRKVRTGPRIESLWIIEEGVKAGDQVIVEGVQKVRDGMTVKATPLEAPPSAQAAPAPAAAAIGAAPSR